MISEKPILYRQNRVRKLLLFLSFLSLLPFVSAWQMNLYHPTLQHTIPLSTIDPEYLWNHLNDPIFQRYNDMSQVRDYLETMSTPTPREPHLSRNDLQKLALYKIYNPYTHQFVRIDSLSPLQLQAFLQEPSTRSATLVQTPLRPMTLKAYYQEKKHLKPVPKKKPLFQSAHLCILWIEHGKVVRQTPPHCDF